MRPGLGVSVLVAVCVAASGVLATEWLEITGPPDLVFPRDHGAHSEYRTEWWYLTGLVDDDAGGRYGFQVTFFRRGLDPADPDPSGSKLRARQILAAHLAVAEVAAQRFHHAERLRRADGGLAGFSEAGLHLWLEDWEMLRSENDLIAVRASDEVAGISLDLVLRPQRGLVLHGDRGYSQKGADPGNASAYSSWTRLAVEGALAINGSPVAVDGSAWFDHEWGTSQLGEGVVGWDWFSLRLDDGRDLMVYRLRRPDGGADPYSSGTLVGPDGEIRHLDRDDFVLEVLDHWQSAETATRYPMGWRIRVPSAEIDLEVMPLVTAAEVDGSRSTGVVYWEGPVEVVGSSGGEGYVELTGYHEPLTGRF